MGIGQISPQFNDMFDQFWKSKCVLSALDLIT
jgi:hypothetical protein